MKKLLLASFLISTSAMAHEAPMDWQYDGWCCKGGTQTGDCAQIKTEAVTVIPGGYQITLKPGDHPLVTRVHVFQVEQAKARQSKDEFYHVCLYPSEDHLRCLYAPTMGY